MCRAYYKYTVDDARKAFPKCLQARLKTFKETILNLQRSSERIKRYPPGGPLLSPCLAAQGRSSSQDERAAAALHAVKMDDGLCGRAVQVRVVQGREPRHFLTLFKGESRENSVSNILGIHQFPLEFYC